ncbi:MAG TPA: DUF934 domain-containing protein [Dongiaceae bacterium]|jgi:uncharacterized protein (DUF934 family)|nr:DUF934 domain-containing protein [Dongiaceae bacterium]
MAILKHGALQPNDWLTVADDQALPDGKPVVVTLDRFLKERDTLIGRNAPIGLKLKSDQSPVAVADDLDRFGLIVLEFPKFTDGRGYSQARILRQRLGYQAELRATGNVLRDQYLFMDRCGIDSIEIADEEKAGGFLDSLGEFSLWYQPAADQRPTVISLRHAKRKESAGASPVLRESVAASWAY